MLGCIINRHNDVQIYLTDEEVAELETETLNGEIFEFYEPENTARLFVAVDRDPPPDLSAGKVQIRKCKLGIGTHDNMDTYNEYRVYLDPKYYKKLKDTGWTGRRDGLIKIDLVTYSFAPQHPEFKSDVKAITSRYERGR